MTTNYNYRTTAAPSAACVDNKGHDPSSCSSSYRWWDQCCFSLRQTLINITAFQQQTWQCAPVVSADFRLRRFDEICLTTAVCSSIPIHAWTMALVLCLYTLLSFEVDFVCDSYEAFVLVLAFDWAAVMIATAFWPAMWYFFLLLIFVDRLHDDEKQG